MKGLVARQCESRLRGCERFASRCLHTKNLKQIIQQRLAHQIAVWEHQIRGFLIEDSSQAQNGRLLPTRLYMCVVFLCRLLFGFDGGVFWFGSMV